MFTFTPLQGAKSDSTAVQSILELDGGVKVLVDVGWDETFDPQKLKELEKYVFLTCMVLSQYIYTRLICHQASPDLIPCPPYPRNNITPGRICALLQAYSPIRAHSCLRDYTCHISGPNIAAGVVRVYATCGDYDS